MKRKEIGSLIWISTIIISFLTLILIIEFKDNNNILGSLGITGDFIGGYVGTIISLFATYLIFSTYSNQKKELKNQRESISQQQFDSIFFNMINVHNELKRNLALNSKSVITNCYDYKEEVEAGIDTKQIIVTDFIGIKVFSLIRLDLEILLKDFLDTKSKNFGLIIKKNEVKDRLSLYRDKEELTKIQKAYEEIAQNYKSILYHYCRNSYHILKFIREEELKTKKDLKRYSDIFQSQLSSDELSVLFYNFLWFDKNDQINEFQPLELVKHFDLFQNADLIFEDHKRYYS